VSVAEVVPIRPLCTIGGSEIAAAAGVDPYRSRVALWLEKTGRLDPPETEAMRWGELLEPAIWNELEDRGYELTVSNPAGLTDAERPWLVGHPDGFVALGAETGVLEVKTASPWVARHEWADGGAPLAYAAQLHHYFHLTGLSVGLLACLVGGRRLELRTVRRDEAIIAGLLALADDFYGYVTTERPPPPDGSDSARDALAAMWPEAAPGKVARLDRAGTAELREYRLRHAAAAAAQRQADEYQQLLQARMGDAETLIGPNDEPVARWPSFTTRRLDTTRLRAELPEIADRYTVATTSRRFTLE
jgi:putative phage-type endonuclease